MTTKSNEKVRLAIKKRYYEPSLWTRLHSQIPPERASVFRRPPKKPPREQVMVHVPLPDGTSDWLMQRDVKNVNAFVRWLGSAPMGNEDCDRVEEAYGWAKTLIWRENAKRSHAPGVRRPRVKRRPVESQGGARRSEKAIARRKRLSATVEALKAANQTAVRAGVRLAPR